MNTVKKYDDIICICMGKKCRAKNSKQIVRKFRKSLKRVSPDRNILLVKTKCMDHCDSGPIVVRNNKIIQHFNIEFI